MRLLCAECDGLVFSKVPHPFGPVALYTTTGSGPEAVSQEGAMPLECPQLLEADLSDRPIQKEAIYGPAAVPVDAEMAHFISGAPPLTMIFRWDYAVGLRVAVHIEGPTTPPHGVGKNGYLVCTFDINGLPVPFNRTILNLVLSWSSTVKPAVCPVAAFFLPVVYSAGSHDVGIKRPTPAATGGVRFGGHRTGENTRPCLVVRAEHYYPIAAWPADVVCFHTETAIVILAIHGPDSAPLVQVHLTGGSPCLFLCSRKCRH